MKTNRFSSALRIIFFCLFICSYLFANNPKSPDQSQDNMGVWVTKFGGGLAVGHNSSNYIILSELGYLNPFNKKYLIGCVVHSEIDVQDNNRFGLNLVLRRRLGNQKSIDIEAGLAFFHIGGYEQLPSFTTSLSFNANTEISITSRVSLPLYKSYEFHIQDNELISDQGKNKIEPVLYVGVLIDSKKGRNLNLIAASTAAVVGLVLFSLFGEDHS